MRAIIFESVGQPLAIENIPDPAPEEDEVVIKVCRCGVCGTDLHITSGQGFTLPPGSQLGHEYAGEVVAIGKAVRNLQVGDRIAGMPALGCGRCEYCKTGIDNFCPHQRTYASAIAEYARVGARGAIKLPSTLSLADGALIEPLAVGRRAVRTARPPPEARVVVIGPGPIGLGVIFWLRRAGVHNLVALASSARRRALAQKMGAQHFVIEGSHSTEQIQQALGGPPTLIFDAAGVPGIIARAIEIVRPQGTIVSLGFCMVPDQIVPGKALMKDISLRFSMTYTRDDYRDCAEALSEDGDRCRAMVTETVGLSEFPASFEGLRTGSRAVCKLLVDPWRL